MKDRRTAVKSRTVLLAALLAALGLLIPGAAEARRASHKHQKKRGQAETRACVAAFDKAKETARDSRLRASSEWFTVCARPSCGNWMRRRCAAVQPKIAALIPSVVPVVTGAAGAANRTIVVRMDGEVLTSNLDGTAIAVDPGDHQFTFATDGEIFATRSVTVDRGRQSQIVSAVFHPPAPVAAAPPAPAPVQRRAKAAEKAPDVVAQDGETEEDRPAPSLLRRASARSVSEEEAPPTGTSWKAYALAGVGALGVGGYFTFNLKGSADNDALRVLCKPDCNPTSVRHVRNLYLAADISLGIGIAALVGSTYYFLRSDSAPEERPRSRSGSSDSHISALGLAPTSSGALATVGGTF